MTTLNDHDEAKAASHSQADDRLDEAYRMIYRTYGSNLEAFVRDVREQSARKAVSKDLVRSLENLTED